MYKVKRRHRTRCCFFLFRMKRETLELADTNKKNDKELLSNIFLLLVFPWPLVRHRQKMNRILHRSWEKRQYGSEVGMQYNWAILQAREIHKVWNERKLLRQQWDLPSWLEKKSKVGIDDKWQKEKMHQKDYDIDGTYKKMNASNLCLDCRTLSRCSERLI